MEFTTIEQAAEAKKPKPQDESKLGFGRIFTDHFFTMKYHSNRGWHDPTLGPLAPLSLAPTAMCLHYGQAIFEGLKAYRGVDGSIYLFRPRENARRLNVSAERICMPTIDQDLFLEAVRRLVIMEKEWVPRGQGTSLYIRPTMIATEAALGVHPAAEYLFFILTGPVGAYYAEGFNPTKIFVSEEFVRAAPGGTGMAKVAGNYAASLMASKIAQSRGYTQVLWLDGARRQYIEEVGTSNIFFVLGDEIVTPSLTGTILPGITRDSVLQLARLWNLKVTERMIAIEEITHAQARGELKEAFASGTAAVISPVGTIHYRGRDLLINEGKVGAITRRLYEELTGIQDGRRPDPLGWRFPIWP
jgi:branched-chain amino acid aminotransferase